MPDASANSPATSHVVTNCGNCAFMDLQPVATPDGRAVIGKTQMVCKLFPPQIVAIPSPSPAGLSINLMPVFPPVNAEVWCYQWEAENGAQDALGDSSPA